MAEVAPPAPPCPPVKDKDAKRVTIEGGFPDAPQGSEHSTRRESSASQLQAPELETVPKKPVKKRHTLVKIADQRLAHDEEWQETHEAEIQAAELIEYMKDNWKVEIDRTSSLIEMAMRTIEISHHERPENHWLLKRAQQKEAEHTGFFSSVRRPYSALGPPELDTPMLVFRNLPDTLKIDCGEWIETQFAKAEAIRKANALLPRMPRLKTSKPRYFRGRIKKGAGGSLVVDKFVRAAEDFQRGIRGSMTYTKLLEQWKQHKEDEAANRGSAFGIVKRSMNTPATPPPVEDPTTTSLGTSGKQKKGKGEKKGRKSSMLDDKLYQIEMLNLEKMILAMYDLIKSMLNIKPKQLRSDLRLAHVTVMQLRDRSPETRLRRKKTVAAADMLKRRRTPRFARNAQPEPPLDDEDEDEVKVEPLTHQEMVLKKSHSRMGTPTVRPDLNAIFKDDKKKYKGTGHVVPKPFNRVTTAEIYPLSEASSAELMPAALDRVKTIIDSATYLDDRPFELLSATVERESTAVTAQRNLKNDDRFRNIFDRKSLPPEPIWHDVKVRYMDKNKNFLTDTVSGRRKGSPTSPSMVDFGLHGNADGNTLSRTEKIPNEADIPTPNLPGAIEEEILDSEEQSRVNLLTKIPGAANDAPPPSPIRRLLRESGIKTTDKEMFTIIMGMKRPFRQSEKNLRHFYTNEVEKYEWETMKRYKAKVQAIFPDPIYEYSISTMREFALQLEDEEVEDETTEKRPALWYRELLEKCEVLGAMKHHGCSAAVQKLHKFCDVDTKSRPQMLNRFCLLVISLPTNELGTPYFQQALKFLLDRLFGSPKELLYEWLSYRGLPYLC